MKLPRALFPLFAIVIGSTLGLAPQSAGLAAAPPAQVALDWNTIAVSAVRAARTTDGITQGSPGSPPITRPLYQTEGLVYMSYVEAAVYDAVMKISHRYRLYHHFEAAAGNASLEAAVIAASYNTLIEYLGDPSGTLAVHYQQSIAALPPNQNTERGIAVGMASAADIKALRTGDGRNAGTPSDAACPPTTNPQPGGYLCPPGVTTLQTPWLARMRPFTFGSPSTFRAPAPPALNSDTFTNDLAETRAYGAKVSPARDLISGAKETAYFWNANAINGINQALRDAATQYNLDLVDTVRLLAMGDMVSTDAGIACFDSKYHYLFWRPITAIRADGNPADATWVPLLATPNHPEYPSQHGCVTSAFVETVAAAVGTRHFNLTIPGATNGGSTLTASRTYATPDDVMNELVNARVWIGFHFRTSVIVGENLGKAVSRWALARYFQPTDDEGDNQSDD